MLENPRKIEQLKLDIDRHSELPSKHIISNLIEGLLKSFDLIMIFGLFKLNKMMIKNANGF